MGVHAENISGRRFGKLVAVGSPIRKKKRNGKFGTFWECKCDCGRTKVVPRSSLTGGKEDQGNLARSCGCLRNDRYLFVATWNERESKKRHIEMYRGARKRAKERGLAFNLDLDDISIPETCPLLGIPLHMERNGPKNDNSPSIDRKDSSKGYVKGNVWVVSLRANRIKSDASIAELEAILRNWKASIDECDHGIPDGDFCEFCNAEYKRAAIDHDEELALAMIRPGHIPYGEHPGD